MRPDFARLLEPHRKFDYRTRYAHGHAFDHENQWNVGIFCDEYPQRHLDVHRRQYHAHARKMGRLLQRLLRPRRRDGLRIRRIQPPVPFDHHEPMTGGIVRQSHVLLTELLPDILDIPGQRGFYDDLLRSPSHQYVLIGARPPSCQLGEFLRH